MHILSCSMEITPDRRHFSRYGRGVVVTVYVSGFSFRSLQIYGSCVEPSFIRAYDVDGCVLMHSCRFDPFGERVPRYLHSNPEALMRFLKRVEASSPANSAAAEDASFAARYPALSEQLTINAWPDGSPRITATMMILVENGKFKLGLHDRDAASSAWFTSTTFDGLLDVAEMALQDGSADFRSKPAPKGAGGGKPR